MVSWNDSLVIGVPQIDDQHRELVNRLDELMQATRQGKGHTEVEKTLRFIVSYVKEHFETEEKLQAEVNYPDLATHKKLHIDFGYTAVELVQDFQKNGIDSDLTAKINKVLVQWLIRHIRTEDKKIAVYINDLQK